MLGELEHLVGEAPLVVVPGDELDEGGGSGLMPAVASKMEVWGSVRKSLETTSSSV